MITLFRGRINTVDGEPIAIFAPNILDTTVPSSAIFKYYNSVQAIEAALPFFDFTATFLVYLPSQANNMRSFGFPSVIDLSAQTITKIYFSNNVYASFSYTTNYVNINFNNNGVINNSVLYASSGNRSRNIAFTFPSVTPKSDNNTYPGLGVSDCNGSQTYILNVFTNSSSVNFWANIEPFEPPVDPYEEGGVSGEGGGDGTFSEEGEDVEVPELPELTAVSTGFIKLYHPSLSQLNSLSTYMWGSNFDITLFKRIFADPMDCILGLSIVPVSVPSGSTETVNIGNISTGISMPRAGSQYVTVDCGSVNVAEFWGSFLDYEPYTKAEIYLPYIGTHPISIDDIMGKTVSVVYHVDILSGACVAYISCGGTVLYNFIGQCSSSIPVTSRDWTNVINGVMNIAGAIGTMVATGGASAPMQIPGMAANAVNAIKPNIEKSGAMGGTGGLMAVQKPYLILTRPRQAHPAQQWKYTGYPSFITSSLDDIGGYTEIESIHLENINALDEELSEIERLLKEGVIF